MKQVIKRAIAIFLSALILVCVVMAIGFLTPAQYKNSFLGELSDKYDRLYGIDEPKIILIGGSSVAFGYDTKKLEAELGMPVVNFGLYASLGTKVMLDLAKDSINEGDIVILAPEMDAQTLSLYFNGESAWQALDSKFSMLLRMDIENYGNLAGTYWGYVKNKLGFLKSGAPDPAGVYNEASFDDHGDIVYERPYNIMTLNYDPNLILSLTPSLPDPEFIDYVNDYIKSAERKGASVYFTFPPMNKKALDPATTEDSLWEFYDFLSRSLDCEIISNINDCIMDAGYFYDSNFHLNDSGVILRTAILLKDIKRAMGVSDIVKIELPPIPEKPPINVGDPNDKEASLFADCFTYEAFDEKGESWIITGVNEKGKTQPAMMIPAFYEGKPVLAIGTYAFEGADSLREITINANIKSILNKAFGKCPSLQIVRLNAKGEDILVENQGGLLEEASPTLKFSVSQDNFGEFVGDYFWQAYSDRFIIE